jgi:hypothetical protein
MSYQFTLQVTRVECVNEQIMEWGKDEMHMIGFGVSRRGQIFSTGYRNLGSYHEGDVNASALVPQVLYKTELPDNGQEVLFYFWLIEEDGGGVRKAAAALELEFRNSYFQKALELNQARFPRDCIPFTAFYKTILPLQDSLDEASTDGLNDEVYLPGDLLLRNESVGETGMDSTQYVTVRRSKKLGEDLVTLRYNYHRVPIVVAEP